MDIVAQHQHRFLLRADRSGRAFLEVDRAAEGLFRRVEQRTAHIDRAFGARRGLLHADRIVDGILPPRQIRSVRHQAAACAVQPDPLIVIDVAVAEQHAHQRQRRRLCAVGRKLAAHRRAVLRLQKPQHTHRRARGRFHVHPHVQRLRRRLTQDQIHAAVLRRPYRHLVPPVGRTGRQRQTDGGLRFARLRRHRGVGQQNGGRPVPIDLGVVDAQMRPCAGGQRIHPNAFCHAVSLLHLSRCPSSPCGSAC